PDLGIAQSTDGSNYNLSIVLPGKAFTAPGNQWQWNWTWTGDGTPAAGASADTVAPTSGSTWNWVWTNTPPDPTTGAAALRPTRRPRRSRPTTARSPSGTRSTLRRPRQASSTSRLSPPSRRAAPTRDSRSSR